MTALTRRLCLACVVAVALAPAFARADIGPPARFELAAFEAAKASGKPVLVEISAPWCPICKAQKPSIAKLRADPRFKDLAAFEIDFDTQKDMVRAVNARNQSTLIVYKGGEEVGRSVGESQFEWIEELLEKAL